MEFPMTFVETVKHWNLDTQMIRNQPSLGLACRACMGSWLSWADVDRLAFECAEHFRFSSCSILLSSFLQYFHPFPSASIHFLPFRSISISPSSNLLVRTLKFLQASSTHGNQSVSFVRRETPCKAKQTLQPCRRWPTAWRSVTSPCQGCFKWEGS